MHYQLNRKLPPIKINPFKKCSCILFLIQPLYFSQPHPKVFLHREVAFTVALTEVCCFPSSVFRKVLWSMKDKGPYRLRCFPSWLPSICSFVGSQNTFTQDSLDYNRNLGGRWRDMVEQAALATEGSDPLAFNLFNYRVGIIAGSTSYKASKTK